MFQGGLHRHGHGVAIEDDGEVVAPTVRRHFSRNQASSDPVEVRRVLSGSFRECFMPADVLVSQ